METKLNLAGISRKQQKYRKNITKNTLNILISLSILGTCINYLHRKKVQEIADKNTFATLIDKQRDNLYLSWDDDPDTVELVVTTSKLDLYYSLTNGTEKSVAEWKKMAKSRRWIFYPKHRTH